MKKRYTITLAKLKDLIREALIPVVSKDLKTAIKDLCDDPESDDAYYALRRHVRNMMQSDERSTRSVEDELESVLDELNVGADDPVRADVMEMPYLTASTDAWVGSTTKYFK